MNQRQGQLLIIGGGVLAVGIVVWLTWLSLTHGTSATVDTKQGITYTDSISGEVLTGFPKGVHSEGNTPNDPPLNQITITGLDDFFGTLNQDQASGILDDLTGFIRAHIGAHGTRAGALNAKISSNHQTPATYTFTLVLVNPSVSYPVTIKMPPGDTALAEVTFGKGSVAP